MEIILCLHNIRSTYNVGAILRTAEGLGIREVICSGYTPSNLNPNLLPHLADKIKNQIAKTALGAEKLVPIHWTDDLKKLLKRYQEDGWQVIGLENRIDDSRKYTLGSPVLLSRLKDKAVLILGEEIQGIDRELYDDVDLFVEIPMVGKKESFNVSVAAGIALYALKTAF